MSSRPMTVRWSFSLRSIDFQRRDNRVTKQKGIFKQALLLAIQIYLAWVHDSDEKKDISLAALDARSRLMRDYVMEQQPGAAES